MDDAEIYYQIVVNEYNQSIERLHRVRGYASIILSVDVLVVTLIGTISSQRLGDLEGERVIISSGLILGLIFFLIGILYCFRTFLKPQELFLWVEKIAEDYKGGKLKINEVTLEMLDAAYTNKLRFEEASSKLRKAIIMTYIGLILTLTPIVINLLR